MSVAVKRSPKRVATPVKVQAQLVLPSGPPYRFSIEQYHRMGELGILTENDRVELLEGLIVAKMSHNPPHDVAVDLAQNAIADQLPEGWRVRVQSVITIDGSEPEPDIAVVRGPARRYAKAHPRSKDVAFLVEVADTTLTEDRDFKGPLYARARIPVYWIVNLREAKVEVYTQPKGRKAAATYHYRQDYETDQSVPLVIEGREVAQIPVRDLLP